jgi:hypothetical protein
MEVIEANKWRKGDLIQMGKEMREIYKKLNIVGETK